MREGCSLQSAAQGGPAQEGEGAVRGSADTSMGDGSPTGGGAGPVSSRTARGL